MGQESKAQIEGLDLYSYEFQSDPVPYLHRLRRGSGASVLARFLVSDPV